MGEQAFAPGPTVRPVGERPADERPDNSSGTGWLRFGGTVVVLAGLFTLVMGVTALVKGEYYAVGPQGTLVVDLTAWGWIHVVVGALALGTGVALALGAGWARVVAVLLVGFNALTQLTFLPVAPVQSTIVIALDVLVIWAVVAHAPRPEPAAGGSFEEFR